LIIHVMEPAAASGARSGARSQERPYVDALLHLAALSIVAADQWQPESIGPLDLAATASEALIAAMCWAFLAVRGSQPATTVLPERFRHLQPLAFCTMTAGLLVMFLGGGHHPH
jgi:hypothetical protein